MTKSNDNGKFIRVGEYKRVDVRDVVCYYKRISERKDKFDFMIILHSGREVIITDDESVIDGFVAQFDTMFGVQ